MAEPHAPLFVAQQPPDELQPVHFYSSRRERESLYPVRRAPDSAARRRAVRKLLLLDGALILLALMLAQPYLSRRSAGIESRLHAGNQDELCQVRLFLQGKLKKEELAVRVWMGGLEQEVSVPRADLIAGVWLNFDFPRQAVGQVVRVEIAGERRSQVLRAVVP